MPSSCTIPDRSDVLNSTRLEVQFGVHLAPSHGLAGADPLVKRERLQVNRGRLLEVLLAAFAFAFVLFGGLREASAAPSGMCSDDAQSIQAPPPLFPADDAVLRGCESEEDFQFSANAHRAPSERIAPDTSPDDPKCVLDVPLPLRKTGTTVRPRENPQEVITSEYRWQGLRPPCHSGR